MPAVSQQAGLLKVQREHNHSLIGLPLTSHRDHRGIIDFVFTEMLLHRPFSAESIQIFGHNVRYRQ